MNAVSLWLIFVVLPSLDELMWIMTLVSALAVFITFMVSTIDDAPKQIRAITKPAAIAFVAFASITVAAPDETQMRTIIGAYIVTNVEGIDQLPHNLVGAANRFLEEYGDAK